jgi:hypothetical protein
MAAERTPVDPKTVATQAGALPVGTRIDVLWTNPLRWETGTVARLDPHLEGRGERISIYYYIAYDDGQSTVEDLRYVQAQLHGTTLPSDESSTLRQEHGRKRRSSSAQPPGTVKHRKDNLSTANNEVEVEVIFGADDDDEVLEVEEEEPLKATGTVPLVSPDCLPQMAPKRFRSPRVKKSSVVKRKSDSKVRRTAV